MKWLVFFFVLFPLVSLASDLRGYGQVSWQRKGKTYRFNQAILIDGPQMVFESLDDLGNTFLRLDFSEGNQLSVSDKKLRKILLIPIGKDEFRRILLSSPEKEAPSCLCEGYRVLHEAPGELTIRSKKSSFKLKWQSLEMNGQKII